MVEKSSFKPMLAKSAKEPLFGGWVSPVYTVDIKYAEITKDDSLRFPAYLRIRENEG